MKKVVPYVLAALLGTASAVRAEEVRFSALENYAKTHASEHSINYYEGGDSHTPDHIEEFSFHQKVPEGTLQGEVSLDYNANNVVTHRSGWVRYETNDITLHFADNNLDGIGDGDLVVMSYQFPDKLGLEVNLSQFTGGQYGIGAGAGYYSDKDMLQPIDGQEVGGSIRTDSNWLIFHRARIVDGLHKLGRLGNRMYQGLLTQLVQTDSVTVPLDNVRAKIKESRPVFEKMIADQSVDYEPWIAVANAYEQKLDGAISNSTPTK